jgi:hypothetical protein
VCGGGEVRLRNSGTYFLTILFLNYKEEDTVKKKCYACVCEKEEIVQNTCRQKIK